MKIQKIILLALTFTALQSHADVYMGRVQEAVGLASQLLGSVCIVHVTIQDHENMYGLMTISSNTTSAQNKFPLALSKSDRYALEKIQGYDYGQHKILSDNFYQTNLSSLVKFKDDKLRVTQEYRRKDVSALYVDADYYKFTCDLTKQ